MTLANFKQIGFQFIKVVASLVIFSAIVLELVNLYIVQQGGQLPSLLKMLLWFGHFALTAHLVEGIIAAFYAPTRGKHPLSYGVYTFFVGTVGLVELFD